MANLTGAYPAFSGDTSIVDTTAAMPIGAQARDKNGAVYEYCNGVTSCLAGSWVTIGATGVISLLTSGASGRVGVAMAAIDTATKAGWVQVYGFNSISLASSNGTITSGGGQLQANSTVPGQVVAQGTSTGSAAGDYLFGAFSYSGQPSSADDTLASVFLNFPFTAVAAAVASS